YTPGYASGSKMSASESSESSQSQESSKKGFSNQGSVLSPFGIPVVGGAYGASGYDQSSKSASSSKSSRSLNQESGITSGITGIGATGLYAPGYASGGKMS
ncbi:hypothetical protein L9G16_19380, partial [Shewanella sp. A25]|nr:hypothetical protein [Shewanella shenzhenensis]